MQDLLQLATPALLSLIGIVLAWGITRGAAAFELWTGIRIDESSRDALHSAIISGVRAALEGGSPKDEVIRHAVIYAHKSVPDAIRRLVPGDGVLDELALRYYNELVLSNIPEPNMPYMTQG